VPKTPETFTYDADGNLFSDGRWNYTWDGENRLVRVESRPDTTQASWRRVEWTYDPLGRRIRQTTSVWTNNTWAVVEDLKLISDPLLFGRHIAELNASDNALVRTYVWGLDLSESMDGAGGVGGLLWVTLHPGSGAGVGTHFCAYDGNGNIVALSAASDGSESARYEYGPFAEPVRATGPAAALNPFRFSTKRTDPTTDLVLYEYRAYSPALGRWLSRDPIGELGGVNLYGGFRNDPVYGIDALGESIVNIPAGKTDGVDVTIHIVIDDKACEVVGINILREPGIDVYVWKYDLSAKVAYRIDCSFYSTSGGVALNFVYVKRPPPPWPKRIMAKTETIKVAGTKETPLCCSCKLNFSWDLSGEITVVPGIIEDPTPKEPSR